MSEVVLTEEQETAGVVLKEGQVVDPVAAPVEEVAVDRPEWLPEKFKAPEELVKSYSELEKVLKDKGRVAPDEYSIDDADAVNVDVDGDVFKAFVDFSKSSNMNNAQFNSVLKFAQENGFLDVPDYETEKAALGADADSIISGLSSFAATKLNPAEKEVLEGMTITAEQTKLLYKMLRMSDRSIPAKPGESAMEGKGDMEKKLQAILSNPNIRNDRNLQAEAVELSNKIAAN